ASPRLHLSITSTNSSGNRDKFATVLCTTLVLLFSPFTGRPRPLPSFSLSPFTNNTDPYSFPPCLLLFLLINISPHLSPLFPPLQPLSSVSSDNTLPPPLHCYILTENTKMGGTSA
ncbi:MAG: hypothetical protein LBK99_01640, partial [Opitutaceae bacterium]|nr:hypothetical protein [Opitutaceae bacterium]